MGEKTYVVLEGRGVLAVAGEDRVLFLQGLVSNDVTKAAPNRALYAAFLTPQGKYLYDFFLAELEETILVDMEGGERQAGFHKKLSMYRLRSQVMLADRSDEMAVLALFGKGVAEALGLPAGKAGAAAPFAGGVAFVDPRLAEAGVRVLAPRADAEAALAAKGFRTADFEAYDRHRIMLGLPDGARDLEVERSILLETGFEELNGVSFDKGCYMGQELTARTKHRALIRKRLVPVAIDGEAPLPGTPILQDGEAAGEMRSNCGDWGLAMIRLENLAKDTPMASGAALVSPRKPAWATF